MYRRASARSFFASNFPPRCFEIASPAPAEHRLKRRAKTHVIVGRAQMERCAHHGGLDDFPVFDGAGKVVAAEIAQPRPQANVGCDGQLRLQADQPLDSRKNGELFTL